uniref:DUF6537 domain-containing protein n=1 Tax=Nocardia abscessus TaxID=120957 RepID=UPI003CC7E5F2
RSTVHTATSVLLPSCGGQVICCRPPRVRMALSMCSAISWIAGVTNPGQLLGGLPGRVERGRLTQLGAVAFSYNQRGGGARDYVATVQRIWEAERRVTDRTEFSQQVARGLYKFTAYKDEYEVARRLTDPAFLAEVAAQVPEGANLTYRLHPPLLRAMGRKKKIGLRPGSHFALRLLAKGKLLRGTAFDPFGYAHVRRVERELRAHYTGMVTNLADMLDRSGYDRAVQAVALADVVRGYEDIKLANVALYAERLRELGIEPPRW